MTHEYAIETEAAVSYALNDLPANEREEFEKHFFDCPVCAQDVRDMTQVCSDLRLATRDPRDCVVPALSPEHNVVAYLLNEQFGAARSEFEEHLKGCFVCRCQVRIGEELVKILREAITRPSPRAAGFHIAYQFAQWIMIVSSEAFGRLAEATIEADVDSPSFSDKVKMLRKQL